MTWNHTRTKKPQRRVFNTWGQAWIQVLMIRQVSPKHKIQFNGEEV
jgi:hypothetical protein